MEDPRHRLHLRLRRPRQMCHPQCGIGQTLDQSRKSHSCASLSWPLGTPSVHNGGRPIASEEQAREHRRGSGQCLVGAVANRSRVSAVSSAWLSDRAVALVTVSVALVGAGVLAVLLVVASSAPGAVRAGLRIEAIKYGLGVIASGGAVAALMLAVRRLRLSELAHDLAMQSQHATEKAQAYSELDAAE